MLDRRFLMSSLQSESNSESSAKSRKRPLSQVSGGTHQDQDTSATMDRPAKRVCLDLSLPQSLNSNSDSDSDSDSDDSSKGDSSEGVDSVASDPNPTGATAPDQPAPPVISQVAVPETDATVLQYEEECKQRYVKALQDRAGKPSFNFDASTHLPALKRFRELLDTLLQDPLHGGTGNPASPVSLAKVYVNLRQLLQDTINARDASTLGMMLTDLQTAFRKQPLFHRVAYLPLLTRCLFGPAQDVFVSRPTRTLLAAFRDATAVSRDAAWWELNQLRTVTYSETGKPLRCPKQYLLRWDRKWLDEIVVVTASPFPEDAFDI